MSKLFFAGAVVVFCLVAAGVTVSFAPLLPIGLAALAAGFLVK